MVGTSNGFVLEVSSEDANRTKECLLDGSSATCWESHSSLKPHWIRISSTTYSMMMNVKRLAISVSRMDRNYCPDNVTVHAGLKNASLHKVCELDIGQQVASTNEVVQVELCPVELEWEVIEIRIHTTLNGGRDCKVRGLEVELEEDVPSSFRTNMARLFEEGEGADVVFAVEGRQVRAHRYILAAQCPVLRSMLVGPFIEANVPREEEIVVHDIEEPVFRECLRFLYTDDLSPQADEMLDSLLVAADKYQIDRLRWLCERGLVRGLCAENCCDSLLLGSSIGAPRLTSAALRFAVQHAADILPTAGLKRLSEYHLCEFRWMCLQAESIHRRTIPDNILWSS
jgi:hypothetical protein